MSDVAILAWALIFCFWMASTWAAVPMPTGSFLGYFTNAEMEKYLEVLHKRRPMFVSEPLIIGKSIEGRNITAVCIGNCGNSTPAVLYTGLIHSREPMSMANLVYFIEYLFHGGTGHRLRPEIHSMLSARQLWFILNLNPDGYHFNHVNSPEGCGDQRKNMRHSCPRALKKHSLRSIRQSTAGVDLNRNFAVCFDHDNKGSSTKGCGEDYRGEYPFSEPEAAALVRFVSRRNFSIALNYHSFGRFINIPNMCKDKGDVASADKKWYNDFGAEATKDTKWSYGHPWDSYLYTVNGDVSDWMYNELGINAMAPEMGPECTTCTRVRDCDGFWPAKSQIVPLSAETVRMNSMAADMAGAMLRLKNINFSHVGSMCRLKAKVWNRGTRATRGGITVLIRDDTHKHLSPVTSVGSLSKYAQSSYINVISDCPKSGRSVWLRVRDKDHCVEYSQDSKGKFVEFLWVNCRGNSKSGKNPERRNSRLMQIQESEVNSTTVNDQYAHGFFFTVISGVALLGALVLLVVAMMKVYKSVRYRQAVSRLHSYDTAAEVVNSGFKDAMDHRFPEPKWDDSWDDTDSQASPTTKYLRSPQDDFSDSESEDSI